MIKRTRLIKFQVCYDDGRVREAWKPCEKSAAQFFAIQALPGQLFTVRSEGLDDQTYLKDKAGDGFGRIIIPSLLGSGTTWRPRFVEEGCTSK